MRLKGGMTFSLIGHAVVLLWALVSFARPLETMPLDSMPVDIISADEFSKMTAGAEKVPPQPQPKPLVEKIAEAKPVEDLNAKVVEKKEVAATTSESTPEPKPKQPDPKLAAASPEPKTEAKAPEKTNEPEQKVDPIAEALKKDETKKPEKKVEHKPQPQKKPEPQPPKFDPRKVAALLDKRDATRLAAAGDTLNSTAALGTARGTAQQLSLNEMDALRARIQQCWTLPAGHDAAKIMLDVHLQLRIDGSLAAMPKVMTAANTPMARVVAESATRAIQMCAPYSFLPATKYDIWKDLIVGFDASWATRM
jgi:hypothetical protein